MNLWLPLMLWLFHMYICICITNTVSIKNHRYSTYHKCLMNQTSLTQQDLTNAHCCSNGLVVTQGKIYCPFHLADVVEVLQTFYLINSLVLTQYEYVCIVVLR